MTTSDDRAGREVAAAQAGVRLRPPGDGECELCGCTPAARLTVQSLTSVAIVYSVGTRTAWLCRSCGLATYRALVSRTLARGWWGVGVFGMPVILLMNRVRLRRALRLAPPARRAPDVAPAVPAPIDPGRPVLARGSGIFASVVCGLVLVGGLVAALTR